MTLDARAVGRGDAETAPVQLDTGLVTGLIEGEVAIYRGIPYAAPPTGDLRWRAPRRPAPWKGVRQAHRFGAVCPQHELPITPFPLGPMDEDCLSLNVWAPATKSREPLPVMVWLSGGAFVAGSGTWPVYDGAPYVRRGVLFVTFNYRVGRFGFFAHPALSAEDHAEPLANYGLMDAIAALEWVRRNIAAFGGDPDNVTMAGQSAGAQIVTALMSAEQARGLFHKAILQSGGGYGGSPAPLRRPEGDEGPCGEDSGLEFVASLKKEISTAEGLRSLTTEEVLGPPPMVGQISTMSLLEDGKIVGMGVPDSFADGRQTPIPVLMGVTDHDLHVWIVKDFSTPPNLLPLAQWMEYPAFVAGLDQLEQGFGVDMATIRDAYGAAGAQDDQSLSQQFQNDHIDGVSRYICNAMASVGAKAYYYRFSAIPSQLRAHSSGLPHAGELAYVFGSFDKMSQSTREQASDQDFAISDAVIDYWSTFCRDGDPNLPGRPHWPVYDLASGRIMEFADDGPILRDGADKRRMDFVIERFASRLRQRRKRV